MGKEKKTNKKKASSPEVLIKKYTKRCVSEP